jgi:hypothetical protein
MCVSNAVRYRMSLKSTICALNAQQQPEHDR